MARRKKNSEKDVTYQVLRCLQMLFCLALIVIGVFLLLGCGVMIVRLRYYDFDKFIDSRISLPIEFLLLFGVLLIAIAWIGIISCCLHFSKGHVTFLVILPLVFLCTFMSWMCLYYFIYLERGNAAFWDDFSLKLKDIFNHYDPRDSANAQLVDRLQQTLSCCGIQNQNSWRSRDYIPPSCCKSPKVDDPRGEPNCGKFVNGDANRVITFDIGNGCEPVFKEFIESYFKYFTILAIAFGLVSVLNFIFAFSLRCLLKDAKRQQEEEQDIIITRIPRLPRNPMGHPNAPTVEMTENHIPTPDYPIGPERMSVREEGDKYAIWAPVVQEYQEINLASRRF